MKLLEGFGGVDLDAFDEFFAANVERRAETCGGEFLRELLRPLEEFAERV